jgi:dihydrofolate synthase/folylpolyglutamate synthase
MNSHHDFEKIMQNRVFTQGINYSLETVLGPLAQFNNPHLSLPPIIHIAGTNGKGSTLAFIDSALRALGVTTGTYTSPHLHSYCERFCINGIPISQSELAHYFELTKHLTTSTEFELLTLIAWLYFKDKSPDYLIIETGLGGRLDATNVITPIVSVITKIGLDHQAILGNTIAKIAAEKAGIIKAKIPVITGQQRPEALEVIQNEAVKKNSPLLIASESDIPSHYSLQGDYQRQNLGIAKAVISHLLPSHDTQKADKGYAIAQNKGRFTVLTPTPTHTVIIDAGHNEDGITSTLETVKKQYPTHHLRVIAGFKHQKNAAQMVAKLTQASTELYYCEFDPQWAMSYEEVCHLTDIPIPPISINSTLDYISKHHPKTNEVTLITGSIYFIAKVI